jgi:hypothetical protein
VIEPPDGSASTRQKDFDDDMIVTPLLTHRVGHDAPMLHLRRHQDDGLFDRFASHTEEREYSCMLFLG